MLELKIWLSSILKVQFKAKYSFVWYHLALFVHFVLSFIIIIIIIIIIYSSEFFTSAIADGFHWSLSESKSLQVSRTLLGILAVLNNAVVWMISTSPPTSRSSGPFYNPLVTAPNAPIAIGIIVTCLFRSFFNSLARSRYLSFFSHCFSFILWSAEIDNFANSLFFVDYY